MRNLNLWPIGNCQVSALVTTMATMGAMNSQPPMVRVPVLSAWEAGS